VRSVNTILPIASTHVIIVEVKDVRVVAFAGTDPIVLANWISDFDIRRSDGGAAEGFAIALKAVEDDILSRLPPDKPVVVTGHSLGGALAVLLARRLAETQRQVVAVYTFGMPRPGLAVFAEAYKASALPSRTYRLVHGDDIVPTVAPSELGFRHIGCYLRAPKNGKFADSIDQNSSDSDDPAFVAGIAEELRESFLHPTAALGHIAHPLQHIAGALTGKPTTLEMRTDLAGIMIETLPPRVRDHMPDRYIAACS
jgi:pimeloyl-ACP methyl ester carboxylesterase